MGMRVLERRFSRMERGFLVALGAFGGFSAIESFAEPPLGLLGSVVVLGISCLLLFVGTRGQWSEKRPR